MGGHDIEFKQGNDKVVLTSSQLAAINDLISEYKDISITLRLGGQDIELQAETYANLMSDLASILTPDQFGAITSNVN